MHDIKGVLLDVDDTLVDTKGAFRYALATAALPYLRSGVDAGEVTNFWRADRNGHYRAHARGEMGHYEQRRLRVADLHLEFGGVELGDDEYAEWERAFEAAFVVGWRAHPDAEPLLDALAEAGIPFGALSNAAFDYQVGKLAAVGLSRVRMLVGQDTLGFGKPDPRVFLEACRRLGTEPAETAYIGDEFDIDGKAAVDAGLVGIWCARAGLDAEVSPEVVSAAGVVRVESLTVVAELLTH